MSKHWGYHCTTCDVSSPTWLNHGEQALRMITRSAPVLIATQLTVEDGLDGYVELEFKGFHDSPSPLAFLWEHLGHTIVLHSEYDRAGSPERLPLPEAELTTVDKLVLGMSIIRRYEFGPAGAEVAASHDEVYCGAYTTIAHMTQQEAELLRALGWRESQDSWHHFV